MCGVGEAKLNLEVPELGAPLHRIAEMLRMTAAAKAVLLLCAIALLAASSRQRRGGLRLGSRSRGLPRQR